MMSSTDTTASTPSQSIQPTPRQPQVINQCLIAYLPVPHHVLCPYDGCPTTSDSGKPRSPGQKDVFSQRVGYLKRHIKEKHGIPIQHSYICICGQICNDKPAQHTVSCDIHNTAVVNDFSDEYNEFPCDQCTATYANRKALLNHITATHVNPAVREITGTAQAERDLLNTTQQVKRSNHRRATPSVPGCNTDPSCVSESPFALQPLPSSQLQPCSLIDRVAIGTLGGVTMFESDVDATMGEFTDTLIDGILAQLCVGAGQTDMGIVAFSSFINQFIKESSDEPQRTVFCESIIGQQTDLSDMCNLLAARTILIPIHPPGHWQLLAVSTVPSPTVTYYCSMANHKPILAHNIVQTICELAQWTRCDLQFPSDASDFQWNHVSVPLQAAGSVDCGPCVLLFAKRLTTAFEDAEQVAPTQCDREVPDIAHQCQALRVNLHQALTQQAWDTRVNRAQLAADNRRKRQSPANSNGLFQAPRRTVRPTTPPSSPSPETPNPFASLIEATYDSNLNGQVQQPSSANNQQATSTKKRSVADRVLPLFDTPDVTNEPNIAADKISKFFVDCIHEEYPTLVRKKRNGHRKQFRRGKKPTRHTDLSSSEIQKLYRRDRKEAIRSITEQDASQCNIPLADIHTHFSSTMGTPAILDIQNVENLLARIPSAPQSTPDTLTEPFKPTEVLEALRSTSKSAPGPDGVTYRALRAADPKAQVICKLYNICLAQARIPDDWKLASALLLHKKGDPSIVTNWRLLCLQSTLYRIFSGLLSKRLHKFAKQHGVWSPCQKGYDTVEGTAEHTYMLQNAVRAARTKRSELAVAWLDLQDAFGSIPHDLLKQVLTRANVSNEFLQVVEDVYTGSSFNVSTANGTTDPIPILRGTKQGDPLSSTAFNICLEPVIRAVTVNTEDCGVTIGDNKHSVLAFADDLAALANHPDQLQAQLDLLSAAAASCNLQFNPTKCKTLHVANGRAQPTKFTLAGSELPHLDEQESCRYLGISLGLRNSEQPSSVIKDALQHSEKILKSRLAPWQKIDAYKTFAHSKLSFHLRHCHFDNTNCLQKYDEAVRSSIKKAIGLPDDACTPFFYSDTHHGGLGIPSARDDHAVLRISHALRLLWSSSTDVRSSAFSELQMVVGQFYKKLPADVTNQHICDFFNSAPIAGRSNTVNNLWMDVRKQIKFLSKSFPIYFHPQRPSFELLFQPVGRHAPIRCDAMGLKGLVRWLKHCLRSSYSNKWRNQFPAQGVVADCMQSSPDCNSFLHSGQNLRYKDYRFIHSARLNVLPTNARRRDSGSKRCRRCNDDQFMETLPHILSHCKMHSARRTSRHDLILDKLTSAIPNKNNDLQIRKNRTVPNIESRNRPDLVVINKKNREITIVDVAVTYESRTQALVAARHNKLRKYTVEKQQLQRLGYKVTLDAFIVGALGCFDPRNNGILQKLGIPGRSHRRVRIECSAEAIRGSCDIFREHMGWDNRASSVANTVPVAAHISSCGTVNNNLRRPNNSPTQQPKQSRDPTSRHRTGTPTPHPEIPSLMSLHIPRPRSLPGSNDPHNEAVNNPSSACSQLGYLGRRNSSMR